MTDDLVAAFLAKGGKVTKLAPVVETVKAPVVKAPKVRAKRVKRNWEAQARYDEMHGTDNGYDARIEAWKREF